MEEGILKFRHWHNVVPCEPALIGPTTHSAQDAPMPRKLPKAYLAKLKEEQVRVAAAKTKSKERAERQAEQGLSSVGMLRSFEGDCASCGQRTKFAVDALGYCKCGRCGALANFRMGVP